MGNLNLFLKERIDQDLPNVEADFRLALVMVARIAVSSLHAERRLLPDLGVCRNAAIGILGRSYSAHDWKTVEIQILSNPAILDRMSVIIWDLALAVRPELMERFARMNPETRSAVVVGRLMAGLSSQAEKAGTLSLLQTRAATSMISWIKAAMEHVPRAPEDDRNLPVLVSTAQLSARWLATAMEDGARLSRRSGPEIPDAAMRVTGFVESRLRRDLADTRSLSGEMRDRALSSAAVGPVKTHRALWERAKWMGVRLDGIADDVEATMSRLGMNPPFPVPRAAEPAARVAARGGQAVSMPGFSSSPSGVASAIMAAGTMEVNQANAGGFRQAGSPGNGFPAGLPGSGAFGSFDDASALGGDGAGDGTSFATRATASRKTGGSR